MTQKAPTSEARKRKYSLDKLPKHQSEPAGKNRDEPYETAKRSQKQAGQDLRDPQKVADDGE